MGIAIDEMELLTHLSRMDRFDGNTVSDIKAVVDSHGRERKGRLGNQDFTGCLLAEQQN